jgi:hypothetical protein
MFGEFGRAGIFVVYLPLGLVRRSGGRRRDRLSRVELCVFVRGTRRSLRSCGFTLRKGGFLRVVSNNDPLIHFPTFRRWGKRGKSSMVLQLKTREETTINIQRKKTTTAKIHEI